MRKEPREMDAYEKYLDSINPTTNNEVTATEKEEYLSDFRREIENLIETYEGLGIETDDLSDILNDFR